MLLLLSFFFSVSCGTIKQKKKNKLVMEPRVSTVRVGGRRIAVVRYLTASPHQRVLFLHGTFVHPDCYRRLFAMFPNWDFVCPTLIGHGLNRCEETGTLDGEKQLRMLLEFVHEQKEDYTVLMGHSFGGTLAVHLNERRKFPRLVLLAPAFRVAPVVANTMFPNILLLPMWVMQVLASLLSRVTYPVVADPAFVADLTVTTRLQIAQERISDSLVLQASPICDVFPYLLSMRTILEGMDGTDTLCSPTTTIILGEEDRVIDMPSIQQFLRGLGVRPVVIPGVGHEMFNEDKDKANTVQAAILHCVQRD